jgi:hypothetical protein
LGSSLMPALVTIFPTIERHLLAFCVDAELDYLRFHGNAYIRVVRHAEMVGGVS